MTCHCYNNNFIKFVKGKASPPKKPDELQSQSGVALETLIRLGSPIPVERCSKTPHIYWSSLRERRPSLEQIKRWRGQFPKCNWGLIPGKSILILDVDSEEANRWLTERGGIPVTPIARSRRGYHIYLRRPEALKGRELPAKIHDEVEIVRSYALLPGSVHPSGFKYYWVISPDEADPQEPHPWLVELLKQKARRPSRNPSPTLTRTPRPGPTLEAPCPTETTAQLPRALAAFVKEVLPYAQENDSNAAIQLGAAIVAHRMDGLRGSDLEGAIGYVNSQVSSDEQVSQRRIRAISQTTERRRYGWSSKVYAERTGTPVEVARLVDGFIKSWDTRPKSERVQMRSHEISFRVRQAIATHGVRKSAGLVILQASIRELANLCGVKVSTLTHRHHRRAIPGVTLLTAPGRSTLWLLTGNPQAIANLVTFIKCLKYIYIGGVGVGRCMPLARVYDTRAGPL